MYNIIIFFIIVIDFKRYYLLMITNQEINTFSCKN